MTKEKKDNICPYIGLFDDPETVTSFPIVENVCHRTKSKQYISLHYQSTHCLSATHQECPGFLNGWPKGLPAEIRPGKRIHSSRLLKYLPWALGVLAVAALVVLFIVAALNQRAVSVAPVPLQIIAATTTPFVLPTEITPTRTLTRTIAPTETVLAMDPAGLATGIVVGTLTPVGTSTLTPGPALLTPFENAEGTFVIYQVKEGESLTLIADLYDTSSAVLQAINRIEGGTVWPGDLIVVWVGRIDPEGLPMLRAYFLEEGISVDDLSVQCDCSVEELTLWNAFGDSEWIEGNRWVIIEDNNEQ